MTIRAFVHISRPGDTYRAGRTLRSLRAAGLAAEEVGKLDAINLSAMLAAGEPILLVRAGAWLVDVENFNPPFPSATGKGLCAFGIIKTPHEAEPHAVRAGAAWRELLSKSGSDFSAVGPANETLAQYCSSLYLDSAAVAWFAAVEALSVGKILALAAANLRLVHVPSLDVYEDHGWRVFQIITALQRGGAERVTLDLMAELPGQNVRVRLATLGRAGREAFPNPPGTLELAGAARDADGRAAALLRAGVAYGADLMHGHLISGADAACIAAGGFPLMLTVHNMRSGWPKGLAHLGSGDASLLAACAHAVERDVIEAKLALPARTARNGIDLGAFRLTSERKTAAEKWRREWNFGKDDFVLIAVANPRPQKRLHLLPAILSQLRDKLGSTREARLVLCGEPLHGNPDAERSVREVNAEVTRLGLEPHVRWTGSVVDVADVLAAADVLVSTSSHEGLSLAQLEALAMERPVVATNVGGAGEIGHPQLHLLPADVSAEEFAAKLASLAAYDLGRAGFDRATLKGWSRQNMAARYRWLYPRAIAARTRRKAGSGLWMVLNNFSTGGAQSSARRLLTSLAGQGVRVRATVVEETPERPTPGRTALLQAGIPVSALPPCDFANTPMAVEGLLDAMDADPPEAVVFWNLRPFFKLLIADALLDVPVFDVSPGEMFFDSLERYFGSPSSFLPYRNGREYGARLAGVVVKFRGEAERAARFLGAPVHVVPNGVSFINPILRPSGNGHSRGRLTVTTTARINPQKRLEDLLEAFHHAHPRLPEYTLRIAGGVERGCDDYANGLRKLAGGLPVEWLGEVSDIAGLHRESDFFAMISEPAGCPNASLEAMATGLPVVATDVGGVSEQVIDRRTGRLIPPRDARAFAEALVELATQPSLRQKMGAAALQHIRDHFTIDRMVADYRRIFLPAKSQSTLAGR